MRAFIVGAICVDVPTSGESVSIISAAGPSELVLVERLLRLGGTADGRAALTVRADAHQLRRDLAPHLLRVDHREHRQIDVERLRDAADLVEPTPERLLVALHEVLVALDPAAVHVAALLEEARLLGVLGEVREGPLHRQTVATEDRLDLLRGRQRRVVGRVRLGLESVALQRVRDDEVRHVGLGARALERLDQALHVVTAEVGEHGQHLRVRQLFEDLRATGVARRQHRARELCVAAVEQVLEVVVGERAVEQPLQRLAAGPLEHLEAAATVADLDHLPAVRERGALDAVGVRRLQTRVERGARAVEALAVVVDDPRHVAEPALRRFGHRLEQRTLAELAVAHERPEVRVLRHLVAVVGGVAVGECEEDRVDRRDADRARGEEVEAVGVGLRVVALEHVRRAGLRELAQPRHRALGLLVREPGPVLAAEEPHEVVVGVVDRRRVRLAADEVLRLAHHEVQGPEQVETARAGRGVPPDLRVAGLLVLAVVRDVDHRDHLREGAVGDAFEQLEAEASGGFVNHVHGEWLGRAARGPGAGAAGWRSRGGDRTVSVPAAGRPPATGAAPSRASGRARPPRAAQKGRGASAARGERGSLDQRERRAAAR
ncbi:MAG: hypothetical protein R3F34_07215 [Planctomycetota bacterium]